MKNVWIVTVGEYSDKRIVCAAPSKKAAKQIITEMRNRAGDRDSYDLGYARAQKVPVVSVLPEARTYWEMLGYVRDDGTVEDKPVESKVKQPWDYHEGERFAETWRGSNPTVGPFCGIQVSGFDEQWVGQVYGDLRAKALANLSMFGVADVNPPT